MPALGYTSPDRKPLKLNLPVDEEFMRRLQALADRLGVRRTVLAREIICKALDKARV